MRSRPLAAIGCLLVATLVGEWLLVYSGEPGSFSHWCSALCFPLFPLVAAIRCFQTARRQTQPERRAWVMFSLALLSMSFAELMWCYYEIFGTNDPPIPSTADLGYALFSLFSILGIWFYRERANTFGVSVLQAGNLGIVLSSIILAYTLVVHGPHVPTLESSAYQMALVHAVLFLAAPAFGLISVSLNVLGPRRAVMGILLLALSTYWVAYFVFFQFLASGVYSQNNPWYGLYLVACALFFYAAAERDRRSERPYDDKTADAAWEARARQFETLIPTVAVATVFVLALAFRENLSEETAPFLAGTIFLFVSSLGVRNWWGQREETRLHAEARANQTLLEAANLDLEREVEMRARTEEELRQSQKMETVGQLAGGIAHDFNNLLSVIQANLELLAMKERQDDDHRDLIEGALKQVERGTSLTQYLLALSRKQSIDPQPIDVVGVLDDIRTVLERTLGKRIRVTISAQDALWRCLADRAQLESSILNLAINARDAMHSGGQLRITARNTALNGGASNGGAHPEVKAGDYLELSVRDTGEGISQPLLARVFEPFFTTKQVGEGTGLGLSMVYGFVKQVGGHIEIESEPGTGTEVRLFLPRASDAEFPAESREQSAPPNGGGESILLVEDEPALRQLLTTLLEGLHYDVTQAANAEEALAICDNPREIDVLLTDVELCGGRTGIELAHAFGRERPNTRILLMSGVEMSTLQKSTDLDVAAQLLRKPFTRQALAQRLKSVLEAPPPLP